MFHRSITGITLLFLALSLTNPATANGYQQCKERAAALETLAREYTEVPMAIGITRNKRIIEVLTTQNGDSWTILVTKSDGQSCILSSGADWTWRKPQPEPVLGREIAARHKPW